MWKGLRQGRLERLPPRHSSQPAQLACGECEGLPARATRRAGDHTFTVTELLVLPCTCPEYGDLSPRTYEVYISRARVMPRA